MDKRGIRLDEPKKTWGGRLATFLILLLLGAVLVLVAAFLTYTILTGTKDNTQIDGNTANTAELNQLFEAYGLVKNSMPEVIPIMQQVDGKNLEVEVKNMLYKTKINAGFPEARDGWLAISVQIRAENLSSLPISLSDRILLLADNVVVNTSNVSSAFLQEYNMKNLNGTVIEAGQTAEGWLSFYIRRSSSFNMFLQIDAGFGYPVDVDISYQ